jgi:hypothetical protein
LPWTQTLLAFEYAMMCSLGINDALKVALIRRLGRRGLES